MNKRQAKEYAYRLLEGIVEEHWHNCKDPLVYDDCFPKEVEGRRMSKSDIRRVEDAMSEITEPFNDKGWKRFIDELNDRRSKRSLVEIYHRVDGKPGSSWKGYKDWRRRQGRG